MLKDVNGSLGDLECQEHSYRNSRKFLDEPREFDDVSMDEVLPFNFQDIKNAADYYAKKLIWPVFIIAGGIGYLAWSHYHPGTDNHNTNPPAVESRDTIHHHTIDGRIH